MYFGSAHAGYARVVFDPVTGPLVLLPEEAAELAPGDAWNLSVEPRTTRVPIADVPRPPDPEQAENRPHSEEVDG